MKKILCLIISLIITSSLAACGKNGGNNESGTIIDNSKTQVYVSCYTGGFGSAWMNAAIEKFNAKSDKYQVIKLPDNKDDMSTILDKVESKTTQADMFMCGSEIRLMSRKGLLMDLSDLYEREVDGRKLKDNIVDLDDWNAALMYDGKYYGVPHNDGIISAVYDRELFEEKDYFIRDNNGNLSAGKDGVAGTYDDGLPATMAEWNEMVENIYSSNVLPFIYSGKFYFYTDFFMMNVWAQYTGIDNFKLNYTFNGDFYSVTTGETTAITTENGYKMFELDKGRDKAVDFTYDYMVNPLYIHPVCNLSKSHTDTQQYYVTGFKNAASNKRSAILFDGIWWENEARPIFNALEKANEQGYAYGEHDYRLLLAPNPDNSYGINGNGKGSALNCNENCSFFAVKTEDKAKEAAVKDFILYLTSNEVSSMYTSMTGGVRPYYYSLSDEQYASMTPFARSVWDTYSDHENVKVIRNPLLIYKNRVNYDAITQNVRPMIYKVNGLSYSSFIDAPRRNIEREAVKAGFAQMFDQATWANILNELK